ATAAPGRVGAGCPPPAARDRPGRRGRGRLARRGPVAAAARQPADRQAAGGEEMRRTAPRERAEGVTNPRPAHAGPFAGTHDQYTALGSAVVGPSLAVPPP